MISVKKAQVSRRSFYRYFLDKYDLINWTYYSEHLIHKKHPEEWNMWDYFPDICKELYEDRKFYYHAYLDHSKNCFRNYCQEQLYPLVYHDFADLFDQYPKEYVDLYINSFTKFIMDLQEKWLSSDPCMPPDEFAEKVRNMAKLIYPRHVKVAEEIHL